MASRKILIIEDNEENLDLFHTFLKRNGYNTLKAKNGLEGVRLAMTEKPHLIITDLQMPIMNGFEVCKNIKSDPSTKNIPVIAISALFSKSSTEKLLKFGFNDYMAKPISLKELVYIVKKYL